MRRYLTYLIPLAIFIALAPFLYKGLSLRPHEIPSPFINKPAPDFTLQKLDNMSEQFSNKDMLGKAWLLNVWASWCVACRDEYPVLMQMARQGNMPIYGLSYKDAPSDARMWLRQHGNPYVLNAVDYKGDVGINYGVYGVPETFVIDKRGISRHKVIGPITEDILHQCLTPLLKMLDEEDPKVKPTEYKGVKACAT
jgi:cytochrome c biogenesis protein CcmG/thiol:disulfide interchange protein DsbE